MKSKVNYRLFAINVNNNYNYLKKEIYGYSKNY